MKDREHRSTRGRGGFALLAVLWVIAAVSLLALGLSLVARQSVWAAQNRVDIARATWKAEACLERARAAIGEALSGRTASSVARSASWATLDDVVRTTPVGAGPACEVSARAAGSAVSFAEADDELLRGVLVAARLPRRRVDSLVDALLDWRDADDVPRPHGAERAWYEERGLHPPRNGPPADVRELSRVRGFSSVGGLDTLFSTERGRIALDHAPLVVLAALPGFTDETVQRVAERRLRGLPVGDLLSLG
ncbi:MAG: general secretion pathway protein GspK, partial [Gemmatimonadaceae bacterium]